jgi:glycyl-tRNA synthetase beta chain
VRLLLTNDVRLSLSQFIELQQVRLSVLNSSASDELAAQLLAEFASEIAQHGVFGTALRTIQDRLDSDIDEDMTGLGDKVETASADLLSFFHDRLKVFLRDEGVRHDVIDACLAMDGADDITLLVTRARALQAVLDTEDGANLIQGFKRANNILTQAETNDGVEYSFGPDIKFAETDEEKALFAALDTAEAAIKPAMQDEDFAAAMSAMATLRGPVDAFFEAVQVNADNDIVRRNRLNLLGRIRVICLQVADLTKIDG